jgi:hypothetical protein
MKQETLESKRLSVISTQPLNIQPVISRSERFYPMTFYNNTFDVSIQCEESMEVSPEEYAEVMQLMADEHDAQQGFAKWSDSNEPGSEPEPEKDWLGNYSNVDNGATYNGIAV